MKRGKRAAWGVKGDGASSALYRHESSDRSVSFQNS